MEQQEIGFIIKQISDKVYAEADAALKKYDLTLSQVRILEYLIRHEGKAPQKEIERHLGVSHPAVVGLVTRLAKADFLTTYVDEKDKRSKMVCITQKAEAIAKQAEENRKAVELKLRGELSQEEIQELCRLLTTVNQNMSGER